MTITADYGLRAWCSSRDAGGRRGGGGDRISGKALKTMGVMGVTSYSVAR